MALSYRSTGRPDPAPSDSLPASVEAYLSSPVAEGGRNNSLFGAAAQLRDIGETEQGAFAILSGKASGDGLPESEIRATIASAFNRPAREAPRSASGATRPVASRRTGRNYTLHPPVETRREPARMISPISAATPMPVPPPIEDGAFEKLLLAAFREGEGVCLSRGRENPTQGEKPVPDTGVTLAREEWLEKARKRGGDIAKVESTKLGLFIRLNPLKPRCENALNEDVTAYRHVLVEFDEDAEGKTIPKDRQLGVMLASGLPITAILDSAGKSLHAWVRIDAASLEEYNRRAAVVYSIFPDIDGQNHNPNRLSRCPDGLRTVDGEVKRQRLLGTNYGAPSWEAWEKIAEAQSKGEGWSLKELAAYDVPNDENNVIGRRWLCRGGSLVIVSNSGVGKSSLTSQLAIGWALARPDMTFGIQPIKPLKQLILQAENDKGDIAEGVQGILSGFGIRDAEMNQADANLFFRRITTLTGEDFLHALEGFVQLYRPDVCWIDPFLSFVGDDVSKQEVISRFCSEGLSRISLSTGVIFAMIHHTGKPVKASDKRGMTASDLAYAGLGSSALTNWAREVMVLQRLEVPEDQPPTFTLTATKRRDRAGMKSLMHDGESGSGQPTAEICIRHCRGRIAWEQCAKPKEDREERQREERPARAGATYQRGSSGRSSGRPSSFSQEDSLSIAAVVSEHGTTRLPTQAIKALAVKLRKPFSTIRDHLYRLADEQARARSELSGE